MPAGAIAVADRPAHVAEGKGLTVFDLSNPETPAAIGSVGLPGTAEAIRVQDGYAYVAGTGGGIAPFSVADPADPKLISSLPEIGYTRDIHVAGSLVVVAAWAGGLRVVSVADPTHPAVVGAWTDEQLVERVEGGDGHLLVSGQSRLVIVSVAHPSAPASQGTFNTGLPSHAVVVADWMGVLVLRGSSRLTPLVGAGRSRLTATSSAWLMGMGACTSSA